MIIRRHMPRMLRRKSIGTSGRSALSTSNNIVRRMTILRLPSAGNFEPEPEPLVQNTPDFAAPSSVSSLSVPSVQTQPEQPKSTLPPDLQSILDFHRERGTPEVEGGIIRRQMDEQKEQRQKNVESRFTRPRPENVRSEPTPIQRVPDTEETMAQPDEIDFPEQPVFEQRRTRSLFEYVNVSSPDKPVQASRSDEAPMLDAMDEEDLPDALPGSYSMDDDTEAAMPTEMIDLSSLGDEEENTPKVNAPQQTSGIQRSTDVSPTSLEGQSSDFAETLSQDTSSEVDAWSAAEQGLGFADLEHGASATQVADTHSETVEVPPAERSSTPTASPPVVQRQTESDTSPSSDTEVSTPSSRNIVQRTPADNTPNIQRDVEQQINHWQTDREFDADEPLTYAPVQDTTDNSADNSTVNTTNTTEIPSSASSSTSNVQRSVEDNTEASPPVQRRTEAATNFTDIQRETDDEVSNWQAEEANVDGEAFIYDSPPVQPSSNESATSIQRSTDFTADEWFDESNDTEQTYEVDAAPTPTIDSTPPVSAGDQPAAIQRSIDSPAPTDNVNPTVNRVDGPAAPPSIQRSIDAEVQDWQAAESGFDNEPLGFPPSSPVIDGGTDSTTTIAVDPPATNATPPPSGRSAVVQRQTAPIDTPQPVQRSVARRQPNEPMPPSETGAKVQRVNTTPTPPPTVQPARISGHIQRNVADEIQNWQQEDTNVPFSAERPEWVPNTMATETSAAPIQRQVATDDQDFEPLVYSATNAPDATQADDSTEQPSLEQALADAGFIVPSDMSKPTSIPPSSTASSTVQRTPDPQSEKDLQRDLLALMNLPPDTPVHTGPMVTVSNPIVQKPAQSSVQRTDADVTAQVGAAAGTGSDADDASGDGDSDGQKVEEMAEKVYRILQRRFRTEIERERGR